MFVRTSPLKCIEDIEMLVNKTLYLNRSRQNCNFSCIYVVYHKYTIEEKKKSGMKKTELILDISK